MPLTMKSRLTPYSAWAVTSLSVAPLRFHSPYAAMLSSFHRTHHIEAPARHVNVEWDGACQDALSPFGSPPPQAPNARLHLLPEAAATQERRLEAVRCKPWLGA